MLKLVRAHGWDRNLSEKRQVQMQSRHKINSAFYSRYTFYDLGYNLRPTEINGFIGNIQIKFINEIIQKRRENFMKIVSLYKKSGKYFPVRYNHMEYLSSFAFPFICRLQKIRDELVEKCNGKIEIRPIVGGDITKQPFFKKYSKEHSWKNLNASLVHAQGLYVGNNPDLTEKELSIIKKIFS
jgi:CDP-6-deoxy-D-xylo-4-hexulose-3-dehydrase